MRISTLWKLEAQVGGQLQRITGIVADSESEALKLAPLLLAVRFSPELAAKAKILRVSALNEVYLESGERKKKRG